MKYFDTSYLARMYLQDPGWRAVRALAASDHVACCLHGKAEVVGAFHRKFREAALTQADLMTLVQQFQADCAHAAFKWIPLSEAVINRVAAVYASLPATGRLRAADAIHLACAAESGFSEIYSNDANLLLAAPNFGLKGANII